MKLAADFVAREISGTTHAAGTLTAWTGLGATRCSSSIAGVPVGPDMFCILQRYFGPPKPADAEALDLLQSECPHLYDELTAAGEVSNVNKLYEIFQLHR